MNKYFVVEFFGFFCFNCFFDEIVCFVKVMVDFECEYVYGRDIMVNNF